MDKLTALFENNRTWAKRMTQEDGTFFERLSKQQSPKYLWIGCSDSRVPANTIVGLLPGEVFVHRNVANQVVPKDLNCFAVIQFAVEALKVEHIIVCGHYGCGGVRSIVEHKDLGLVTEWLHPMAELRDRHTDTLKTFKNDDGRAVRLCELNVAEQVRRVCESSIVQGAWKAKQRLVVHGWVYSLQDGLLKDLLTRPITGPSDKIELA